MGPIGLWGIVVAYLGAIFALQASWRAIPKTEKGKYRALFQTSVVIMGVGALMQLADRIPGL